MTKTLTAILALVSGFVGLGAVAEAHAASQSVMMSTQTFQNRCVTHDGVFAGGGDNFGCQVGELIVECTFFAAGADCEWNGKNQQVAVVRLLGMPEAQPIIDGGTGGVVPGAKKGGGMAEKASGVLREAKF